MPIFPLPSVQKPANCQLLNSSGSPKTYLTTIVFNDYRYFTFSTRVNKHMVHGRFTLLYVLIIYLITFFFKGLPGPCCIWSASLSVNYNFFQFNTFNLSVYSIQLLFFILSGIYCQQKKVFL